MIQKAIVPILICLITSFFFLNMNIQTVIPLYNNGKIPNSKPTADREDYHYETGGILIVTDISRPTLTVFLPSKEKATGAAIIICPGGGYANLAMGHEGTDVARWFNEHGIAAFVLKYRIPEDSTMINKEIGPLQDAQRALLIVRSGAIQWGIDPRRVGIMGFSAGGHLASTAGTHFEKRLIDNPGLIPLRPDFMILIYPVISFNPQIAHLGSEHNLLGPNPSAEKIKEYSNELQVTDQTPPAFLVHAMDDQVVPPANSVEFAGALKRHRVPVELHLIDHGGHGFGMHYPASGRPWMELCIEWLKKEGFIKPKA
jgi:acetyl esterase/lipase